MFLTENSFNLEMKPTWEANPKKLGHFNEASIYITTPQ
tara:strand:- start:18 stop:131 length:114 start_codon:yes stop_codon:yes gene_type:complete